MSADVSGGGSLQRPAAARPDRVIPFGKYLLLDRIAVGGMAEVYTAKSFGIEGFEKIIAIKRILPTMAEDEEFIHMFIDEAKIAGHLTHANVVPIFELGKIGESHYIAMEYVWGKDLLQIMNRFRRLRRHMPPSMGAFIGSKMCEGLDFAHRKKDRHGRPLGIIHRDVSPQNCICSYEGQVKMIDFGIAKAAARNTKTQAGVLKGKFGYMSPEQVAGRPVDHRSDIFAVGTCMYEMLTGERLFVGESDFSTLEKVRNADVVPLSAAVADMPAGLSEIVMKALARDPDERWQYAGEMQEALTGFIASEKPPFGTSKLGSWLKTAFAPEIAKEKSRLDGWSKVGPPAVPPPPPRPPANRVADPNDSARGRATARPMPTPRPMQAMASTDDVEEFEDEPDELQGESTMISSSPFDEMMDAQAAGDDQDELQGEATQIFFSADDLDESPPATAPATAAATAPAPIPISGGLPPPRYDDRPTEAPGMGYAGAPALGAPAVQGHGPSPETVLHASPYGQPGAPPPPFGGAPPPAFTPQGGPQPLAFSAPPGAHGAPPLVDPFQLGQPPPRPANETIEIARPPVQKKSRVGLFVGVFGGVAALAAVAMLIVFLTSGPGGGTIEIRTTPADVGATVIVDGTPRGRAPLRLEHVPTGDHAVVVQADGYQPATQTVGVGDNSVSLMQFGLVAAAAGAPAAALAGAPTAVGAVVPGAETPPDPTAVAAVDPAAAAAAAAAIAAAAPAAAVRAPPTTPSTTTGSADTSSGRSGSSGMAATIVPRGSSGSGSSGSGSSGSGSSGSGSSGSGSSASGSSASGSSVTGSSGTASSGGGGPTRLTPEQVDALSASGGSTSTSTATPRGRRTPRETTPREPPPPREPASSAGRGFLVIQTIPWSRVFVDGRDTGRNTPVRRLPVSAGSHRLGLRTADGQMHEFTVEVEAGGETRFMRQL